MKEDSPHPLSGILGKYGGEEWDALQAEVRKQQADEQEHAMHESKTPAGTCDKCGETMFAGDMVWTPNLGITRWCQKCEDQRRAEEEAGRVPLTPEEVEEALAPYGISGACGDCGGLQSHLPGCSHYRPTG